MCVGGDFSALQYGREEDDESVMSITEADSEATQGILEGVNNPDCTRPLDYPDG